MIIRFIHLEREYEILSGKLNHIVIENTGTFYHTLRALQKQIDGEAEEVLVRDNDKEIPFNKMVDVITSPLEISYAGTTVKKKIIQSLSEDIELSGDVDRLSEIYTELANVLEQIVTKSDLDIDYEIPANPGELFSGFSIHIDEHKDAFPEALEQYIKTMHRLIGKKIFIIYNCCGYLEEGDYRRLLKVVEYEGVRLLFIDNVQPEIEGWKNVYIIDKDLCDLH